MKSSSCVVGEHLKSPGDRQQDQADGCRLEKKVVSALPADQELGPMAPRQEQVSAHKRNKEQAEPHQTLR